MPAHHPVAATCEEILREQMPNLLRLYLSPHVTQACFCLARYVQTTWSDTSACQSFLANSFDEALSGAIKLARYAANVAGRPTTGLVLDPADRLGPFAAAGEVEFVPGLVVARENDLATGVAGGPFGLLVLVPGTEPVPEARADALRLLIRRDAPLIITCVNRASLAALRRGELPPLREITPDIVVFDESFVDRAVPFGALTARKALYDHWNRPGKATFHSTTYQPNTISSLHFVRCLPLSDAAFHESVAADLRRIETDMEFRGERFRSLYSPSLCRLIRATGFNTPDVRAAGNFVHVNGRPIFDAVSGVACSIRGHNPATYAAEMAELDRLPACEVQLAARLRELTGMEGMLPAVSGASAVENALKLALVAQFPKRHVLALRAGFGGKTLLALTGTANPAYKEHVGPLYADVVYVDPFAADAETQIEAALEKYPVAVVQLELIQAVGGVRPVPEWVVRYLEARRSRWGYFLLVDEVQTGMYRTGPFTRSGALGLTPDLLLLGKGTSDMMFPFALLLYSAVVRDKLAGANPELPAALHRRHRYELGFRTVLNVLRLAEKLSLSQRVAESGELFARLLRDGLGHCRAVREVRAYGLLIGIELDIGRWPRRWLRKRLAPLCLLSMLRHRRYPVLAGFCQYEPNVLKITPSLTVGQDEIRAVCATITDVLKRPLYRLLAAALAGLFKLSGVWRKTHEHAHDRAHDPAAR
jgi:acetylornithine/succinyldiaminopimelate/putrescine aminotransferase